MSRSYDAALIVLQGVADRLVAAGRPVPDRVCVATGADPVWDCEQLTVNVTRPSVVGTLTLEARTGRPRPQPRYLELRIDLVRPVPFGDGENPPTVDDTQTAARELLEDADALGELTPFEVTGRVGAYALVGAVTLQGPEGGYAAATVTVSLMP